MPKEKKHSGSPVSMDIAVHSLQQTGLKITQPRLAILSVLINHHGPFTMDEIHGEIKEKNIDRVTVYRCIDAFQEHALVRRCDFGDGPVRFEYQGIGSDHHHHVICRKCKKVENLNHCLVEKLESSLQKSGYSDVTHSLEFFGICAKCQKKGLAKRH